MNNNNVEKVFFDTEKLIPNEKSKTTIMGVEKTEILSRFHIIKIKTLIRYTISKLLYLLSYLIVNFQIKNCSKITENGMQYRDNFHIVYFILYRSISTTIFSALIIKYNNIYIPKLKEIKKKRWVFLCAIFYFISLFFMIRMLKYLRFITVISFNCYIYSIISTLVISLIFNIKIDLKYLISCIAFITAVICLYINEVKNKVVNLDQDNFASLTNTSHISHTSYTNNINNTSNTNDIINVINISDILETIQQRYFITSYNIDIVLGISYGIIHNIFFGLFLIVEDKAKRTSGIENDVLVFMKGLTNIFIGIIYVLFTHKSLKIFLNVWLMLGSLANGLFIYLSVILSRRFENNLSEKNSLLCNLFGYQIIAILISVFILKEEFYLLDFIGSFVIQLMLVVFILCESKAKEKD